MGNGRRNDLKYQHTHTHTHWNYRESGRIGFGILRLHNINGGQVRRSEGPTAITFVTSGPSGAPLFPQKEDRPAFGALRGVPSIAYHLLPHRQASLTHNFIFVICRNIYTHTHIPVGTQIYK